MRGSSRGVPPDRQDPGGGTGVPSEVGYGTVKTVDDDKLDVHFETSATSACWIASCEAGLMGVADGMC